MTTASREATIEAGQATCQCGRRRCDHTLGELRACHEAATARARPCKEHIPASPDGISNIATSVGSGWRTVPLRWIGGAVSMLTRALRITLKLSVVATSTSMREGRSDRAQTTPESVDTSPDWMPWVIIGRSAARLRYGLKIPLMAVTDSDDAAVAANRRRVSNARDRSESAMEPPRLIRGGPCLAILTETQR